MCVSSEPASSWFFGSTLLILMLSFLFFLHLFTLCLEFCLFLPTNLRLLPTPSSSPAPSGRLLSPSFTSERLINNASALPERSLSWRLQHLRRCNQSKLKKPKSAQNRRSRASDERIGIRFPRRTFWRRRTPAVFLFLLFFFPVYSSPGTFSRRRKQ